jgi:DNA repair ATPase RecN
LAQIACIANRHHYVRKFERAGPVLTALAHLASEKERVPEFPRMLSGTQIHHALPERHGAKEQVGWG